MNKREGVSIVIPAYNEEQGLPWVLDELNKIVKSNEGPFEIIIVNDGSTDGTGRILKERNGINLINNQVSLGYGMSIKKGIEAARYPWIAIADADGTYPVSQMPLLLQYRTDNDMIVGRRKYINYKHFRLLKQAGRKLFYCLVELLTFHRIPDINSGLRIFKKELSVNYGDSLCNGFSFTTTLTLMMLFNNKKVHFVPIEYFPRMGETKVKLFRDVPKTLMVTIYLAVRHAFPRLLFLLLGFFFFCWIFYVALT